MRWDDDAFRGCGMVVDWLRDRWFYASLVAMGDRPLTPTDLLVTFRAAREANLALFGIYSVYPENIARHLSALSRAGLIEARPRRGRRREYVVTGLGTDLLDSLHDAGTYGRDRWDWLVRYAREQQHMDTRVPAPSMRIPGDTDAAVEERLRRRATAMLFGVALGPKWTFSILAVLARGPLRPYRIIGVVNGAVRANSDVFAGSLVDSVLGARLDALQRAGLVIRIPASEGYRTSYGLTLGGRALMEALEPVAAFGVARDAEMTAAVRAV